MSRPRWLAEGWEYDGAGGLLDPGGRAYLPSELDRLSANAEPRHQLTGTAVDGAQAILDAPEQVPALWGDGNRVLHAEGEPFAGAERFGGAVVRDGLLQSADDGNTMAHVCFLHERLAM